MTYYSKLNNSGFSLIGVLSAAAIGTIVILGISQFQVNLMRSLKKVQQKSNSIELSEDIIHLLEQTETCPPNALNSPKPPGKNVGDTCIYQNACSLILKNLNFRDIRHTKQDIYALYRNNVLTYRNAAPHKTRYRTTNIPFGFETWKEYNGLTIQKIELRAGEVRGTSRDGYLDLFVYYGTDKEKIFPVLAPIKIKIKVVGGVGEEIVNNKKCYAIGGKIEGGSGIDPECYKVDSDGRTLVGCGTTGASTNKHTAFGFEVGTGGSEGTFVGYKAGEVNTGNYNSFIGYNTGLNNISGGYNTFFGRRAGADNNGGSNVFIGHEAGSRNTIGNNNIALGDNAQFGPSGSTTGSNNIVIGGGMRLSATDASNKLNIGNLIKGNMSGTKFVNIAGDIKINGGVTHHSDKRLKTKIKDLKNQTHSLLKLNPKTFYWKDKHRVQTKQIGLIAQEVQEQYPELVSEGSDPKKTLSLNYQGLIPVIIKTFKEFYGSTTKTLNFLKESVSALTKSFAKIKESFTKSIDFITKEMAKLKETQLQTEKKLASTNKKLERELASLKKENESLKAQNKKQNEDIKLLKTNFKSLMKKMNH